MENQSFNRELKFRVWNNRTKQWIHGPNQEVNLFGECILLGGFMQVSLDELNDCIALQFTGLKDKNGKGKEIYEGDIVEYSNFGGNKAKGTVEFKNGGFVVRSLDIGDTHSLHFILGVSGKVIGNIFENPKLI